MWSALGIILDRDGVLTTIDRERFARDVLARIPLHEQEIARRWKAWRAGQPVRDVEEEEAQIGAFLSALATELELADDDRRALVQLDYLPYVRAYDDARPALIEARRRGVRILECFRNGQL